MRVKQPRGLAGRIQAGTQNKGQTLIRDEPPKNGSMVLFKVFLTLETDDFQNQILVSFKEFLFMALRRTCKCIKCERKQNIYQIPMNHYPSLLSTSKHFAYWKQTYSTLFSWGARLDFREAKLSYRKL